MQNPSSASPRSTTRRISISAAKSWTTTTTPRCAARGTAGGPHERRSASGNPMSELRTRRPTLADLAREAGTSPSTASRALSGRGYVSRDMRTKLLDAADRLGYVPNLSARNLKQRTSCVVGVVVSDLGNQFYAQLAAGIEQTLREAGYQMVLLGDNSETAAELDGARTFVAMRAPGVIMTPVAPETAGLLAAHGTAVVEVDRRLA